MSHGEVAQQLSQRSDQEQGDEEHGERLDEQHANQVETELPAWKKAKYQAVSFVIVGNQDTSRTDPTRTTSMTSASPSYLSNTLHNPTATSTPSSSSTRSDIRTYHPFGQLVEQFKVSSMHGSADTDLMSLADRLRNVFIIDTAATYHSVQDASLCEPGSVRKLDEPGGVYIKGATGHRERVYYVGSVALTPELTLNRVLILPNSDANLISVSCLMESDIHCVFKKTGGYMSHTDPHTKRRNIVLTYDRPDGVFWTYQREPIACDRGNINADSESSRTQAVETRGQPLALEASSNLVVTYADVEGNSTTTSRSVFDWNAVHYRGADGKLFVPLAGQCSQE